MTPTAPEQTLTHANLASGVEFAADVAPDRHSVALTFRVLAGMADERPELTGLAGIVEDALDKGTKNFTGRALADAFDAIGAQWTSASGRQSTIVRVVCLPEYATRAVDLVAEMIARPTFPDEACNVAVKLSIEERRHMEDDPQDLLGLDIRKLTYGPNLGRYPGGELETLARITPEDVRAFWKAHYHAGRLQVAVAGAVDEIALGERIDEAFRGFGDSQTSGRAAAPLDFTAQRSHRPKDLKQQYIAISLPGAARGTPEFPVEQVLLGVLSGGMSGRLFTEVREKQGLVYWVGAWSEQTRGGGVITLGASTTPERGEQTYSTLMRELERLSEDLADEEMERARNSLVAHAETEDDLTRARASALSDDLFHHGKPIGLAEKIERVRRVTAGQVRDYARNLQRDRICVATVGPREMK